MKETLNMSVGSVSIFGKIAIENRLQDYFTLLNEKHHVGTINWSLWCELLEIINDGLVNQETINQILNFFNLLKYDEYYKELLKSDDLIVLEKLEKLFAKGKDYNEKIKSLSSYLSYISNQEERKSNKIKSVRTALWTTASPYLISEEKMEKLMEEYALKCEMKEVMIDENWMTNFGKYAMLKFVDNFNFAYSYLSQWNSLDYSLAIKMVNFYLDKYKDDENLDKIIELLLNKSSSYVYCKKNKKFKFLDYKLARHTESVMEFVCEEFGYSNELDIPYELYPECDKFIKENIVIKGAYDKEDSLTWHGFLRKENYYA